MLLKNDKMEFIWNTEVKEIHGDDTKVTSVVLHNNQTNQDSNYDVDGLFIYIGEQPVTDLLVIYQLLMIKVGSLLMMLCKLKLMEFLLLVM